MIKPALFAAALIAGGLLAQPATAQAGGHQRMLVIYGNDACPRSNGEEVVICVRRREDERYRIPPQFRQGDPLYNKTWADRAKSLEYVGASGVRSCSPVGPGGASGCFDQMVRDYKADRKAAAEEVPVFGK